MQDMAVSTKRLVKMKLLLQKYKENVQGNLESYKKICCILVWVAIEVKI